MSIDTNEREQMIRGHATSLVWLLSAGAVLTLMLGFFWPITTHACPELVAKICFNERATQAVYVFGGVISFIVSANLAIQLEPFAMESIHIRQYATRIVDLGDWLRDHLRVHFGKV